MLRLALDLNRSDERIVEIDARSLAFASPLDLAATAAWASYNAHQGHDTILRIPTQPDPARYLERMDFYNTLEHHGVHLDGVRPTTGRRDRRRTLIEVWPITTPDDVTNFATRTEGIVRHQLGRPASLAMLKMVGELLDNALTHSASPVGVFAAAQTYPQSRRIEIGVADAGIGIRTHLTRNPKYRHLRCDTDAIAHALRPGVSGTGDDRGNGLSDLLAIASQTRGQLLMRSGDAVANISVAPYDTPSQRFDQANAAATGTWVSLATHFL
jgi:hypothetical protein